MTSFKSHLEYTKPFDGQLLVIYTTEARFTTPKKSQKPVQTPFTLDGGSPDPPEGLGATLGHPRSAREAQGDQSTGRWAALWGFRSPGRGSGSGGSGPGTTDTRLVLAKYVEVEEFHL